MNKSESKYFNTAIKMDEALIELLDKKDFEYITIKEICEKAGVNRSTFYLHYENTYDLLTETLEHINNKFMSYFKANADDTIEKIRNGELQDLIFITPEYLLPYLNYIKENQHIFVAAIKKPNIYKSNAKFDSLYKYVFEPVFERFSLPENERLYTISFYINGIMGIITEWVRADCKTDAADIADIISRLIFGKTKLEKDRFV